MVLRSVCGKWGVGAWDENQEHLAQLDGGTTRLGARLARALREEKGTGGGWRDPVTSAMRSSLSPLQRGRKPRNNSHDPEVAVLLCCQMVIIWCGVEERAPMKKLRELRPDLPDGFACFPVIPLEEVAMVGVVEGAQSLDTTGC